MDDHVVMNILLNYYPKMENWSTTRLLNKSFKKLVDEQKYDNGIWGRRSFIQSNLCEICDKQKSNIKMLIYPSDDIANKRIITHCTNWFCKISAIRSMISHCKINDIYLLIKPFQPKKKIIIPRSDGSETDGFCKKNCLFKKNDQWFVYVTWYSETDKYTKLVPLSYYTDNSPKLIFSMGF
tara:strand:+ start:128 stop:670 length:543 start_codon:yes stop_codon:yes gene_type:complete